VPFAGIFGGTRIIVSSDVQTEISGKHDEAAWVQRRDQTDGERESEGEIFIAEITNFGFGPALKIKNIGGEKPAVTPDKSGNRRNPEDYDRK
jgi:hypothetical protein|tara:strand:+ start:815 stop:1090 length:276 start_codon:yes stop_codon:yes gene_type:complete